MVKAAAAFREQDALKQRKVSLSLSFSLSLSLSLYIAFREQGALKRRVRSRQNLS
jgi:hypothetical protein